MRRSVGQVRILLVMILIAACGTSDPSSIDQTVARQTVIDLVCGAENQTDCVAKVCKDADACPLFEALSNQAVFDFVKTYSPCEGCNTAEFPAQLGIGKCIEYQVLAIQTGWAVNFSVSENCSFRYGNPGGSQIRVDVNSKDLNIKRIQPPVAYIDDPSYCQREEDCYCLSGSGVPFLGCSNLLYAPLNGSGYYAGDDCRCVSGQCKEK